MMVKRVAFLAAWVVCLAACSKTDPQTSKGAPSPDLSKEASYSAYRFGREAGVVDIGIQPLALPHSTVGELIARDGVLTAQLAARGVRHTIHDFNNGTDINHFLFRADLEAGIAGDIPALTAAATGDIVIAGMLKQGYSSIIARQPMLVKDLKGKRVATVTGSTAHFTLLNALANEGLTGNDVTIVPLETRDMPSALAEKRIDAFCAWEPTPAIALTGNQGFYLVHKDINMGFLYFRKDFITAYPEAAYQIAAAAARACIWMRKPGNLDTATGWSMEAASHFLGKPFPLDTARVAAIISNDLLHIPNAPQLDERMLRDNDLLWREFNFLKKTGTIPATVTWEKVRNSFDTGMMRQVLADEKRYGLNRFDYRAGDPSRQEARK